MKYSELHVKIKRQAYNDFLKHFKSKIIQTKLKL